jgi:hypothetical protein
MAAKVVHEDSLIKAGKQDTKTLYKTCAVFASIKTGFTRTPLRKQAIWERNAATGEINIH